MRRCLLTVLLCAPLVLGVGLTKPPQEPKAEDPGPPVEVVLTAESQTIEAGQVPAFSVRLINRSDETICLVGSLDGSDVGWRYPKLTAQREGPVETAAIGRCGNMNNLREEDFVTLKPGQGFDPYDAERGFFGNQVLREKLTEPGEYTFTLTYDTDEHDIGKWWGFMGPGEPTAGMKRRFAKVPKGTFESNTVTITVTPKNEKP